MNEIDQNQRAAAIALLSTGESARSVAGKLGIHRNTVLAMRKTMIGPGGIPNPPCRIKERSPQKVSTGKGDDEFAGVPMTKSRRQYLRLKAAGHFKQRRCKDCGGPCANQKCYNCWRRTAALKRLAKTHAPDSEEYALGVIEIYGTNFTHPSEQQ